MKFRLFLLVVLLSTLPSFSQIYTNLDNTTTGWTIDTWDSGGGGGTGYLYEITTPPSGHGLKAVVDGIGWSNVLFYTTLPATTANYFSYDIQGYTTTLNGIQALEFDWYVYNNPYRFMFGSQCVINGDWWGWNDNRQLSGQGSGWVDLGIPCVWTNNKWHRVQWWGHRDPISTANCPGYHKDGTPGNFTCSYQDILGVDDVYWQVNLKTPASDLPVGWSNASGAQFQLDQNASGIEIGMGVTDLNFTELGN